MIIMYAHYLCNAKISINDIAAINYRIKIYNVRPILMVHNKNTSLSISFLFSMKMLLLIIAFFKIIACDQKVAGLNPIWMSSLKEFSIGSCKHSWPCAWSLSLLSIICLYVQKESKSGYVNRNITMYAMNAIWCFACQWNSSNVGGFCPLVDLEE